MNRYQKLCLKIAKHRARDEVEKDKYLQALEYFYRVEKSCNRTMTLKDVFKLYNSYKPNK